MNKKLFIIGIWSLLILGSCSKDQFSEHYSDPSKISSSTVEEQFAGFLYKGLTMNICQYTPYFVWYQNTALPWSQVAATLNTNGRYIPGSAVTGGIWSNYYAFLAQYKELLKINAALSTSDQATKRVFIIAATIYYYDYTQKMVDLFGDIPWSKAGLLGTNGGNYQASYAAYDSAATIYTTMLDTLKSYATELNSITVPTSETSVFKIQDFVNSGNITLWKRYCNSLRLRLLTRVNGVSSFQSRVNSEIATIAGDTTTYPIVSDYSENIKINIVNYTSGSINNGSGTGTSASFYCGLIGWGYAHYANKMMIDTMNNNADPRLRVMFEPAIKGGYLGMDPSLTSTEQESVSYDSTLSYYNRRTLTQNNYLPGLLINASEVNLMLAEYYLNAGNDTKAKAAYEAGITASINYYYYCSSISNSTIIDAPSALTSTEVTNYLASNIAWNKAIATTQKKYLIALQKWINYGALEPLEAWAEQRRVKFIPTTSFMTDVSKQTLPPNRFTYPSDEVTYNATNYAAVSSKDNLTTKIFWDVN